ncbi:MAG: cytochrome P450 [Actinomycetota bacterium]|nr:cytochrome P450 [Actinomycetota bacterium]
MTDVAVDPQSFPVIRPTAFDPPTRLGELRERQPLSRLRFADGHFGWLVTNHTMARELLTDQRFSAQAKGRRPVIARLGEDNPDGPRSLPGMFVMMDPPEHTRFRRLLTGQFTARRMKQLEPRIAQIVEGHLDAMLHAGPPADLMQSFALPIPSLVICELLGVPYADRAQFQRDSETTFSYNATQEEASAAMQSILGFMAELVARKRIEPDETIISGLIATGELTDEEIAGVSFLLLIAGHETTANMLALGTFALLGNPDQLAALRADPSLITGAVEELLRYLSIVQFSVVRGALEDVEVHGQLVKAGESVCIALPAANRDPAKFADPDTLDVRRSASGHLAFGHGVHQCIGQQLARIEMRHGYDALLRKIPTLRLAVAPQDVPMRDKAVAYGVHELPITWKVQ